MKFKITVHGRGRGIPAICHFLDDVRWSRHTDKHGHLTIELPSGETLPAIMVQPLVSGYWLVAAQAFEGTELHVDCPILPAGARAWWHDIMNLPIDPTLGDGIRIGVVDTPFLTKGLKRKVRQISPRIHHPSEADPLSHGAQVCSVLVGPPSKRGGFAGVCRGATVIHASALGKDGRSLPGTVASAIHELVHKRVDIINLSLGDVKKHSDAVKMALEDAVNAGVVVIAASGNQRALRYPAAYEECLAIGAIGKVDYAPDRSNAAWEELAASQAFINEGKLLFRKETLFRCAFSGVGSNIAAVAPGCGIIFDVNGQGPFDLIGTSFAAPLAAGLLANVLAADPTYKALPRKKERYDYARAAFIALCRTLNLAQSVEGHGLPRRP